MTDTPSLIRAYYDAFNRADPDAMLALLTEDVAHDINQGSRESGRDAFARFMQRMNTAYRERLTDMVVMATPDGSRGGGIYCARDLSGGGGRPAAGARAELCAAGGRVF